MPYYYGGQGPAQYTMHQQSRRDRQFQNMINMMLQMQQFKQRQKQWQEGQEFKWEQLDVRKKEQEATEKYYEHLAKPKLPTPSSTMKTIEYMVATGIAPDRKSAYDMFKGWKPEEQIRMEARAKAEGKALGTPPKTPTISTYDKKKADLDKARDEGHISDKEYYQSLFNLKQGVTPKEAIQKGSTTRDANARFVQNTFKDIDKVATAKSQIKGVPGAVPTKDGLRLDMPHKYNLAQLNIGDGRETEEDLKIIADYDEMFQKFQDEILPMYDNFKQFRQGNPRLRYTGPDKSTKWDMLQLKDWFKIYK